MKNTEEKNDEKVPRVGVSLDSDSHEKLKKLAISCDTNKTNLAAELITMCLNHPDIINHFQEKYNKNEKYRIVYINAGGKLIY